MTPIPPLPDYEGTRPLPSCRSSAAPLLCNRDDIFVSEKQIDVFSSHQPCGLMNKLMGHNMMRKDGAANLNDRRPRSCVNGASLQLLAPGQFYPLRAAI
jgi:hypothetical protein